MVTHDLQHRIGSGYLTACILLAQWLYVSFRVGHCAISWPCMQASSACFLPWQGPDATGFEPKHLLASTNRVLPPPDCPPNGWKGDQAYYGCGRLRCRQRRMGMEELAVRYCSSQRMQRSAVDQGLQVLATRNSTPMAACPWSHGVPPVLQHAPFSESVTLWL
jgi:hypothetical protein